MGPVHTPAVPHTDGIPGSANPKTLPPPLQALLARIVWRGQELEPTLSIGAKGTGRKTVADMHRACVTFQQRRRRC
jgi:hypothetical protein